MTMGARLWLSFSIPLLLSRAGIALRHGSAPNRTQRECVGADADLHILFSTGCNAFQNWQAEVLLNSAYHVGQCGKITRIIAGCDAKAHHERHATHPVGDADRIIVEDELSKSIYPNLNVHVAPAIPEAKQFPWYNKPWSFHHWLMQQKSLDHRALAIIDPDEFFMQPLTQHGGVWEEDAKARRRSPEQRPLLVNTLRKPGQNITDVVEPGVAVAQQYGLGTAMFHRFNPKTICPGGLESPCARVREKDAEVWYPAGPPYILHRDDFKTVIPDWWKMMKPVYAQDRGDIIADMYAYVFATMHNNVRHTLLDNYMVSNTDMEGEAWSFVDRIEDMSCQSPTFPQDQPLPGFLHAAGHFKACTKADSTDYDMEKCPKEGSMLWNFHKGHVPTQILDCEHPLLMPPPDDFYNVQVKARNQRGRYNAFLICNFVHMINRAAVEFKGKYCSAGFNDKKCTRIVTGSGIQKSLRNPGNPWDYPLAEVDMDCCPGCGSSASGGQ